jgi:hypothetical protein
MLLDDAMLLEAVGRQGGYEEVEKSLGAWNAIAKALGQRKTDGESLKYRCAPRPRQAEVGRVCARLAQ